MHYILTFNPPPSPSYPIICSEIYFTDNINLNNKIILIIRIILCILLIILCISLFILSYFTRTYNNTYNKKFLCNLLLIIIICILFTSSFIWKINCF
jgi:hypothetical protein